MAQLGALMSHLTTPNQRRRTRVGLVELIEEWAGMVLLLTMILGPILALVDAM